MGRLAKIEKEYAGTGLQFLSVCTDVYKWDGGTGDTAKLYIENTGAEYTHVTATTQLMGGLSYIPSGHIYNSSGTLIAKVTGEHTDEEWINIIETLLAR